MWNRVWNFRALGYLCFTQLGGEGRGVIHVNIRNCEENYGWVDGSLMNAKIRGTCFTEICGF